MVIGTFSQTLNVASLGAGATTTLDFTYTPTTTGTISIVTTADSGSAIPESNEANNALTTPSAVYYNGYKGKRFTAGNDFTTVNTYTGRDGVVYSTGTAAYQSANWMSYSASFTAGASSANLIIPSGATIVSARLYQSTNWDQTTGENPAALWTATFSGTTSGTVIPTATYTDRKGYGSYNYPSEVYMYDVTSYFNKAGTNTWSLSSGTALNVALYPAYMVVVFRDPATQTEKTIFIDDECDLLYSKTTYNTNNAEATAFASFTGVDVTGMGSAKAIAFVAAVNEDGQSQFIFNNVDKDDFFISASASTSQTVSIREFTLTNVENGANEAKLQSRDATDGDNMQAQNVILIIEKTEGAVAITSLGASTTSGTAPLSVTFTPVTSGQIVSYAWTFEGTLGTDYEFLDGTSAMSQNPKVKYLKSGIYDVSLTVTGIGTGNTATKEEPDYIHVGVPTVTITITKDGIPNGAIDFGTMQANVDETDSRTVNVEVSGPAWSVTAADARTTAHKGFMTTSGDMNLFSPFQLSKDGTDFHAMTSDFTGFLTGAADEDKSGPAYVKQSIAGTDGPGLYSITVTFTYSFIS
jgi:PKD repeat protein